MASISIQVSSPQNGAVLWGPASGVWVDVSGTVAVEGAIITGTKSVEVELGSGGPGGPAQLSGNTWSYEGLVTAQGPLTITATATVLYSARGETLEASDSVDVTVSVKFDTTAPQLTIDALPNGGKVYGDTAKISTTITGTAADSQTGVDLVKCDVDGVEFPVTTASGWSKWSAVCEVPYGQHTVTVRCADKVGNIATKQVAVEAVDNTAPTLSIDEPPDFFTKLGDETGAKIKISGTATDPQSGVAAVEWALDDSSQYKQATTQTNWAAWSAEVQVPPDMHDIKVRARDKKNNVSGVKEKPVRVSLSFKPGDQEDNVSHLAYLRDLIEFARSHVDVALPGGESRSLELRDLTRQFFQPFGDLTSNEQVRQLRICIEVLRNYLDPRPSAYWRFDESDGVGALDSSGNGNAGTLQGPTRTAGRDGGGALQFDGVDDVVKLDGASYGDAMNNFTVAFWANPQATHEIDLQSTSGVGGTSGQRYAIDPAQGGTLYGAPEHACAGVSVGTNGISVYEHSDGYMPALLVHQVPISAWTHVAVVYENKQPKLYINGTLAKTGLASLKEFVHLNPQTLGGMSYGFFNGLLDDVRVYDRALSAVEVQDLFSPLPTGEVVWVEDALPAGATANVGGGDAWSWVSTNPAPFSGTKAHQSDAAAGVHQHYFAGASTPLAVKRGDKLFAYVYLDPLNKPEEVMLQWYDGTWEHRAYWGKNKIEWGTDGTNSRRRMGDLPKAGEWVRLEVPASQVGLGNRMVNGMAFTLYGGSAMWDRAGKVGYQVSLEAAESRYRQAAYQTLLNNLGTSYEELRLARHQPGQDQDMQKALAGRLGIDLDAAQPDRLDKLLLQPGGITEAALEKLFGLADTTRDPLSARPVPDLLSWRLEHLRTLWKEQDHPTGQDADSTPPIIDPDLVRQEDLIAPTPDKPNPAFDIWQARSEWVNERLSQLANDKVSGETDEDRLERLVGSTPSGSTEKLSMADLLDLDAERQQGSDIEPELQKKRLSTGAFSYLVRMHNLAAAGSLLDPEWSDVYSILVQVEKLHKYEDWRKEEINLTLSTDYFTLSADATTIDPSSPRLPAWRATERERQAWQNTLRARADQDLAVAQGLQAAVDTAEEATLALLRDALVEAIEGGRSSADVSNWLTDWLQIDVRGTARRKTTRIKQAIETLQGVLFSLRTNRFKDMEAETDLEPISPRPDWELAVDDASDFDQEWAWMGSYATWRAAMLVFLYPENLLLPSLRGSTTKAFQEQLVKRLRGNHQLTPEQARVAAGDYLAALRNEEKTETAWVEDELPTGATPGQTGTFSHAGQNWVSESWSWVSDTPAPFSGEKAHQSTTDTGIHQHYFQEATSPLQVDPGDKLYTYVYLDLADQPSEIMLQWRAGTSWEHRAYWGANEIEWGTDGTNSRRRMGDLPKAGEWVRLEVPASQVGLDGKTVSGMAFTLYGGRATWDRAGRYSLPPELEITDRLSETELSGRYETAERLFAGIKNPSEAPAYVQEAFYFVPMYLALQLQKSRQYTAALDWFRTAYAYDLPLQDRKIYYGLELEDSIEPSYERVLTKWLLGDDLNPHFVATKRRNAYTRFTLLSIVRCFLDFADSEFTNETGESISRARNLYLSALELLDLDELQPPKDAGFAPNPVIEALRLHAELNLFKLRDNRNIAGMQRETEPALPQRMLHSLPTIGGGGQLTLPGARILRPTPYRYSSLVERAKQLVAIAQQIEAAYLSALERMGTEGYTELKAQQDLDLAKAGVDLQNLRVTEANGGVTLATLQQQRSQFQADHYDGLIKKGISGLERDSLTAQWVAFGLHGLAAASYGTAAALGIYSFETLKKSGANIASSIGQTSSALAAMSSTLSSILATHASYERRAQEWQFQMNLAQKDVAIGAQQITSAQDRVNVVKQELSIAQTQEINADATVNFLTTKRFATAELYEWMSGVLGGVYGYFLQQATAMARLAQNQLAFERQEGVLSIVQADYWQPPSDGGIVANGSDGKAPDRRGLTGSARLLQDIYQLDQYAFETERRKLQLTKTISLAREAPFEFQRFRETGVLPFATPMEMFDRDFPGHYLRLIKRVRTSVIALVPPTQGIRATLATTGISRVTTSGDGIFQTVPVHRDPELVALSSPSNATGLFELDQQSDMLLPFEAMGVDTSWELQMPKAANLFDYRTIADVLITIEYTALNDFDYRQQVIQGLDHTVSADRPFSLRQQFPDQWYDLHNPDETATPMTVSFDTTREDFPPNVDDLAIQHIVLYIVRSGGQPFAQPLTVNLYFTPQDGIEDGGGANSEDGVFSTRRGNANEWLNKICYRIPEGTGPEGVWRLTLPDTQDVRNLFKNEEIEDILFVITYSGRTPEWPT